MTTLTPRQLEILRLSAEGFSGPQIAVRLHVTVATVNEHRTRIRNRLGASTAAHAVALAYQRGILQGFDGTDVLRQLDSARAWAVEWQQEAAAREAESSFIVARRLTDGSGAYFGADRCTGISSDALAHYGIGQGPEPAPHEYPRDESDLAACERTYDVAPSHVQDRMLSVLMLYREAVAKGAA